MIFNRTVNPDMNIFLLMPAVICLSVICLPLTAQADYVRIRGSIVNVRQGPGTSYPVYFQAIEGDEFPLVATEGLWCLIRLEDGREAWVYGKLVSKMEGAMAGIPAEDKAGTEVSVQPRAGGDFAGIAAALTIFILAGIAVWRRREIKAWLGIRMREIAGYRRGQPFRYDKRHPDNDRWEI